MRADQPVVSAASWMVSASTRPNLIKVVSRFGRLEDRLALLARLLVEPDHGPGGRVGRAHAVDDVGRLHVVVGGPGGVDVDLGARRGRALAPDRRLLVLALAQTGGLPGGRALGRARRAAALLAQALG